MYKSSKYFIFVSRILLIASLFIWIGSLVIQAQTLYPQNNGLINQPNINYFGNSSVFKQEIARMEINVVRAGKTPLSITQVPRLEKDDIIKARLLEEPVNSLKPDQSNFDWTFLIAFINPGRNNDSTKTVSEEINFRKKGWYKEYSFVVPYDSQAIFFLYPKPQYRSKILNLINKNQDVIQKIGEKTIEIADAYAKIGMFLTELQGVVNRNYFRNFNNNFNFSYGMYGNNNRNFGYNDTFLAEQTVERIARSFNIQLPNCWVGNQYNPYNNNPNNGYNPYNNFNQNGMTNDLIGKVQCVAKTVRIEDFDISVAQMLQQGGIFAAAQLTQKYPQIAFWINIAAAALDFIIKVTNRAPLKLVPTIVSANENPNVAYLQSPTAQKSGVSSSKISLFAETSPNDNGFVTAYPMVFHKWQANADPNSIDLPMPILADTCLHAGQNIIRTTDIVNDWMADNLTKEFQLTISSANGYKKEYPLKKNIGFGGWELALTKEDLNEIPKNTNQIDAKITGKRGFNNIQSPIFNIHLPSIGNWMVEPNSQKLFTVGGKRTVTLQNKNGDCRCLDSIVYKSSSGNEVIFDTKKFSYSPDGKEVSFEIDTTNSSSGLGQLEVRQYGGDLVNISLSLYPMPPNIIDVKVSKGDSQIIIIGERLDQIQAIRVNGKRAIVKNKDLSNSQNSSTNMYLGSATNREKMFVFENLGQLQDSNSFSLELELSDQRIIKSPNLFGVSVARPIIVSNEFKEIDGSIINYVNSVNTDSKNKLESALTKSSIFPMEVSKIGINIKNALTDYDFKIENLQIETRVENSEFNPIQESDITFEVLDWKNIKLNISLTEQSKKMLGGRRIQFRILDTKRGTSDWYSVKQTFVRIPQISSVKCLNKQCEIIGKGLNYIQEISVDDGKNWFPQDSSGFVTKSTDNGLEIAVIPNVSDNSRVLKIKLRDFPKAESITVNKFD